MVNKVPKVLVIHGVWGHTEDVLTDMDIPFTLVEQEEVESDISIITSYDIVVVDCPGWNGYPEASEALKAYANNGGTLIFTDIALLDLAALFPNYVNVISNTDCVSVFKVHYLGDPLTQYSLGETLPIYTMGGGIIADQVLDPSVRVILDTNNYNESGRYRIGAFYFPYGKGMVDGYAYHPQEQEENRTGDPNSKMFSAALYGNKFFHGATVLHLVLTVKAEGEGTVTPALGQHLYSKGESVTLTATPQTGWGFSHWKINGQDTDKTDSTITITMDANKEVTAVFKAGEVKGKVTDEKGNVIENASVSITNGQATFTANINANGEYVISDSIATGDYTAIASKAGYSTDNKSVTITAGVNTINFSLTQLNEVGSLKGKVTDSIGNIVGAKVSLTVGAKVYSAITDTVGEYTINDIPTGTYAVTASKTGYVSASKNVTIAKGTNTANFTLTKEPQEITVTASVYGADYDGAKMQFKVGADYSAKINLNSDEPFKTSDFDYLVISFAEGLEEDDVLKLYADGVEVNDAVYNEVYSFVYLSKSGSTRFAVIDLDALDTSTVKTYILKRNDEAVFEFVY